MKMHRFLLFTFAVLLFSHGQSLLAQGPLENGGNHEGTTSPVGEEDTWTFTANAGDYIVLRCGEVSGTASYNPFIRLFAPGGALMAQNNGSGDSFINVRATNSGTFSVIVSSGSANQTGSYNLRFVKAPGAFIVPAGDEGGALVNGGNHNGTNSLGDEDVWSFTAAVGDNITLRAGEVAGSFSYNPYLRLIGPTGVQIAVDNETSDSYLNHRATNAGVYTVLISSANLGQTGSYSLRYVNVPQAYTVPAGDEGGTLTNGMNHFGVTANGDEDVWSFTASVGDNITLRCGELTGTGSYNPYLRLIGPTGIQVAFDNDAADSFINHRATNNGVYTVLVGAWFRGHTGTYNLRYAKAPGEFTIPSDDEGGPLNNGGNHLGTIANGDEDTWTFNAAVGDNLTVRVGELTGTANFYPYLRLIGPTGVQIAFDNDASDSYINHRATNAGTYTVLVGAWFQGHSGTYSLRYVNSQQPYSVPADDEGGTLTNGVSHLGATINGDEDVWSFTASVGENITMRVGEITGSSSYNPFVRLIGPTGVQIAFDNDASDSIINHRATNSGVYTVIVGAWFHGHTGTYRLNYVKAPGEFVIASDDEGGALTNGANHAGVTLNGDEDMWSFSAAVGDNITLRVGELTGTSSYYPYIRLVGPTGVLVAFQNDSSDSYINYRATNAGVYTVVVGSWFAGHSGTYNLRYINSQTPFIVPADDEGGPLVNGGNHTGTTLLGDEDLWSFNAAVGDNITLRVGELSGTSSYNPFLRLIGPTGVLIAQDNDASDSYLNHVATNAGTYKVIVGSWFAGYTGTYNLRFAKTPGDYTVPLGDEGGELINGGNHAGVTAVGDIDMWSFNATAGDQIILRCGETGGTASYNPFISLLGPTGTLIAFDNDDSDSFVSFVATNTGIHTVLVGSWFSGPSGTYNLTYVNVPGAFIVPAGDEGGSFTGTSHEGTVTLGDEDVWRFTLCPGEPIALRCTELTGTSSFNPWLRLYGPGGNLITWDNDATESVVNHTATNGGTYTVVIGSYFSGHTGTYRLTHNSLSFEFRDCAPRVRGTNVTISAVGGTPGARFVALTSTEVATPLSQWTPFLTNQFNRLGIYLHTNRFDRTEPKRFFTTRQE
jgi:hypothetical protein